MNLEADREEIYWEQRVRVNWLKNGDRNTSYFHKIAVQRHICSQIKELERENGERISTNEDMLKFASDFFGKLFSASDLGSDEHVFGLVEKRVNDDMNNFLLQQFTEEDITYIVKTMAPLKASGIDSFSAIFF
ncbi:hypothetical protein PVK06_043746 [Gossypium arboreum]|uniref:Uncharacterized protein n=1 Tax=Gossypium arboreum TaxID=29729 RepID=A0ABR0MRV3_GOSAR|nr:hypothetical protein PVK06_043746 [Gossypium arboreum]